MKMPSEMELRLLALTVTERTGLEIAEAYRGETGKRLSPGSLYTICGRMKERGWLNVRDGEDEDGRLRWFKITGPGAKALNAGRAHYRSVADFGLERGTA